MDDLMLLYVTVPSEGEAAGIARTLVSERLCACANIIGGLRSFYWWEGEVQDDREVLVVAKTRMALVEQATDRIRDLHSATLPCIVAWPITAGHRPFLHWIGAETGAPPTAEV